jgi:hypothetical protein
MDPNQLVSSTVELGLDLLEKNGTFLPFCKAVNEMGETFLYTAASDTDFSNDQAYQSVLSHVKRDLVPRGLRGAAFCFHSRVTLSDSPEKVPVVEVEVHYRGLQGMIWYFCYKTEGSKASVTEYFTNPAHEYLLAWPHDPPPDPTHIRLA